MRGLGVRKFAGQLGLSPSLVSSYLNGTRLPTAATLRAVGERTGVSLDWLLFGEGGEQPVMRGQWRSEAGLEADVAARVAREAAQRLTRDFGEVVITVDGVRLLAAAAEQVAMNYCVWARRLAATAAALMPVTEMGVELVDFADRLAKELQPGAAAHFRRHARRPGRRRGVWSAGPPAPGAALRRTAGPGCLHVLHALPRCARTAGAGAHSPSRPRDRARGAPLCPAGGDSAQAPALGPPDEVSPGASQLLPNARERRQK